MSKETKIKIILRRRPLSWVFRPDWYSTERCKRPHMLIDGSMDYLVDLGMFTFGLNLKKVLKLPKIVLKKPIRKLRVVLRYWRPKRITLKCNPRIHAWLWWNF